MIENLYKLPWTMNNNPNGWIEPTTACQLKCPHCYRGADRDNFQPAHRALADVWQEVDELIKRRNIQALTISGGEPLLYPQLDQLIKYAVKKKLRVMILTNGILLDRSRLINLKELGVERVMIHIDKYQNREATGTEAGVNQLRSKYCDLFREVGEISLGFIMPISNSNFNDLNILIPFFKDNADIIKLCFFTILCGEYSQTEFLDEKIVNPEKVFSKVRELYGLEYCAYLGKTLTDNISWLFSYNIFAGKSYLGSLDKNFAKFIQAENYKREQRYLFVANENLNTPKFFSFIILNKSTRKILLKYLFRFNQGKIHDQIVAIVNTPQRKDGQFDLCDGCPDAILHNGQLVPSCLLERIKADG